jgi:glucose-6-phosphate isomerase
MITLKHSYPAVNPEKATHETLLAKFQATIQRADIGFFRHTADKSVATLAKTTARRYAHKKLLVHVGIGGSSLGPEMLLSALGIEDGKSVQFLNNIDADMLARQERRWVMPDTFFYIVSKSGGTAETLAALSIILKWLEKNGVTESQWKEHIVICTDPQKGELRQFAREHQLSCLDVPPSVGGRFSVLTDVGLFTAAWAGVNVDQLVHGAEAIKSQLLEASAEKNILTQTAAWLEGQRAAGRNLTVLMPYSSLLKEFTAWWVQLWAESLGKEGIGLTPIMAYGASDQHSQMQLFMQGPADKTMIFLRTEVGSKDYPLTSNIKLPGMQALAPFKLSQLMEAEYSGTLTALQEAKRPLLDFAVGKVNAESLGGLIVFFESLTALVGVTSGIDPFNQPGVEAGKKYAHEWLGRNRP